MTRSVTVHIILSNHRWQIKARVSAKSDIKHYTNAKGDGKLFNVTFTDESGQIKATAFNEAVDRFYTALEDSKVYYISKLSVKGARKQYNNSGHEYELYFEGGTDIKPVAYSLLVSGTEPMN